MVIQIDSREKPKAITKILDEFNRQHIRSFVSKLPVGDYQSLDNARLVIDRKQNLSELCGNVCQQHERFKAEFERANRLGIQVIILCEHGSTIKEMRDVAHWENPRRKVSPYALNGSALFGRLCTIQRKYGVQFEFCAKNETGRRIVELLKSQTEDFSPVVEREVL